jgi:hypothetical protein
MWIILDLDDDHASFEVWLVESTCEQLAQVGCSHLIFVDLQLVPCFEGHL